MHDCIYSVCTHGLWSWISTGADYGIPHLRQLDKETFKEKEERRKASAQRVYLAPEVRDLPSSESTPPPADVYRYVL